MTSSLLAESYRPSCVWIGRVVSVLAELLCIGRFCLSFESGHNLYELAIINVLLIVN